MNFWESFLLGMGTVAVLVGLDLMPDLWTPHFWLTVVGAGLVASVLGSIANRLQKGDSK